MEEEFKNQIIKLKNNLYSYNDKQFTVRNGRVINPNLSKEELDDIQSRYNYYSKSKNDSNNIFQGFDYGKGITPDKFVFVSNDYGQRQSLPYGLIGLPKETKMSTGDRSYRTATYPNYSYIPLGQGAVNISDITDNNYKNIIETLEYSHNKDKKYEIHPATISAILLYGYLTPYDPERIAEKNTFGKGKLGTFGGLTYDQALARQQEMKDAEGFNADLGKWGLDGKWGAQSQKEWARYQEWKELQKLKLENEKLNLDTNGLQRLESPKKYLSVSGQTATSVPSSSVKVNIPELGKSFSATNYFGGTEPIVRRTAEYLESNLPKLELKPSINPSERWNQGYKGSDKLKQERYRNTAEKLKNHQWIKHLLSLDDMTKENGWAEKVAIEDAIKRDFKGVEGIRARDILNGYLGEKVFKLGGKLTYTDYLNL